MAAVAGNYLARRIAGFPTSQPGATAPASMAPSRRLAERGKRSRSATAPPSCDAHLRRLPDAATRLRVTSNATSNALTMRRVASALLIFSLGSALCVRTGSVTRRRLLQLSSAAAAAGGPVCAANAAPSFVSELQGPVQDAIAPGHWIGQCVAQGEPAHMHVCTLQLLRSLV